MNKFHYLFHLIAYYVAWFSCINLAAHGYAWLSSFIVIACVSIQMVWQYKVQHQTRGLWYFIGLIVLISTLVDSLLIFNEIIIYAANPFAPYVTSPWMITIWISFGLIFYATLQNLINHLIPLGLLSFAGFALAFAMGAKMGAVFFPYVIKLAFLSVQFGLFYSLFLYYITRKHWI